MIGAFVLLGIADLFFDIQHFGRPEESRTIAIVDISDVTDRLTDVVAINAE